MSILPIVRHMLLCEDWRRDGRNNNRVSILGLIWTIQARIGHTYPLQHSELCVFLTLTGGRGQGEGCIICVDEDDPHRRVIFQTSKRPIHFPSDPLAVIGVPFRIRDILFPRPGRSSVQFWYNDVMVVEQPLQLR